VEKTLQILEETLYHRGRTSRTAVQKSSRIPLEKKQVTLSSFETSHPSIVLALELFLCFQLKQSSHFCFKKEFHIKTQRSFVF
jgi:hypothetical protein